MLLGIFGKSIEGREQPYAVFSRPMVTYPWQAVATGKPVVVLAANVHGGEQTLRESNLILIRELATKGTEANKLLDNLVIIMVPSINVDGSVLRSRGNDQNVDMNRDYMKLEQPELANYVKNIILTWSPHLFVDGHNGGSPPYNICHQGPSNAASDPQLTLLCDEEIFPYINNRMHKDGYKAWYYTGGDSLRWQTGGFDPRIGRNYGGFINSVAILFESPGQTMEDGVKSGIVAYKATLEYAAKNPDRLKQVVEKARRETVEWGQKAIGDIPVQMKYAPEDYKVTYEIVSGRGTERKAVTITNAELIKKPIVVKTRPRPYAYILEMRAYKAVEMLKRHNIVIEVLQKDTELPVEAYIMTNIKRASEYDHPAATTVTVADTMAKRTMIFPKGTYIIRTGQVMGRVVTHLLEPETDDNVIRWNTLDAILPSLGRTQSDIPPEERPVAVTPPVTPTRQPQTQQRRGPAPVIPIFKLMTPTPLPTRILEY
jgi:hypothetical protein